MPQKPTAHKKNSSFEGKWATSQTKAQKSLKDDFIQEIWRCATNADCRLADRRPADLQSR